MNLSPLTLINSQSDLNIEQLTQRVVQRDRAMRGAAPREIEGDVDVLTSSTRRLLDTVRAAYDKQGSAAYDDRELLLKEAFPTTADRTRANAAAKRVTEYFVAHCTPKPSDQH